MPIDTNAEKWEDSSHIDYMSVELGKMFRENEDTAYTLEEIDDYLIENEPQVLPDTLVGDEDEVHSARLALISTELERLNWLNRIVIKELEGDLYYTYDDGDWRYPLATIYYDLPEDIEELDDELSEDIQEITNRLRRVEQKVSEEIGLY